MTRPTPRRRETPTKRVNPSGEVVWRARYTDRHGRRKFAGTYASRGPCRSPVEGRWHGDKWEGCCAHHAIDAAYERQTSQPENPNTLGGYRDLWLKIHPRSEATNAENRWRTDRVLAIELGGLELRDWSMSDIRRRDALTVQARLLEQGRSAEGVTGIMRAMSAMTNDAIDDEVCNGNPWLRLGVKRTDPRVQRQPRAKRIWTMEQMHEFATVAAAVRDLDRDEPTQIELWRRVYAKAMIRLLSDCGLRFGELHPLERGDLSGGWLHVRRTVRDGRVQAGTKTTHHLPEEEQGRDIPIPPSTEALLRALPARLDPPLLFTTPRGHLWRERNWRRDVWTPARKATGMDATPQQFRASWESIMRAAGVDPADLAAYAGHSVATANSHYVQALHRSADAVRGVVG